MVQMVQHHTQINVLAVLDERFRRLWRPSEPARNAGAGGHGYQTAHCAQDLFTIVCIQALMLPIICLLCTRRMLALFLCMLYLFDVNASWNACA